MKPNHMIPVLTLAMAILGSQPAAADDAVVAKVGSREIKAAEISPYLAALRPDERTALFANKEELARFVRAILLRQAVLQEATEAGWDKRPEVVTGLARTRDQFVVESYLAEVAKVPADYPSEDELKKTYEAEKEKLTVPRRFELSQIYIAGQPGDAAAKKKADELAAQLKGRPDDFGRLARENSNEQASAARDGKIGWLPEDQIAPEIRKAISGLSKGQITPAVEGRDGYHIVRVDEVRAAGPASFEEVRKDLASLLRERRAAQNREAHISTLLERQPVSVNEIALDALNAAPAN
ncbi:MAG: peptidylprolyl isomerase [Chthoniobacterales bacterium]